MKHKYWCATSEIGACSCGLRTWLDMLATTYGPWASGAPLEPTFKELSLDEAVGALIECQSGSFQGMVENLKRKGIVLCREK